MVDRDERAGQTGQTVVNFVVVSSENLPMARAPIHDYLIHNHLVVAFCGPSFQSTAVVVDRFWRLFPRECFPLVLFSTVR